MSKAYFTADWHLGHRNILKYRPNFKSIEEHDTTIFSNYTNIVKKRDIVYFLGDICFDKTYLDKLRNLPGRKVLVLGNHDTEHLSVSDLLFAFDEIISLKSYKGFWLSHAPIHPEELRGKLNIHGHTHYGKIKDTRYINVCVEQTYYAPIELHDIKESLNETS